MDNAMTPSDVETIITRSCPVNRNHTFQDAINATGRKPYCNSNVVSTAPKCEGDFEGMFVNIGWIVDCDKLDTVLSELGFELIVDPQGLADLNASDPEFADKYPNGTQWKNKDGKFCCAVFSRWDGERDVVVDQDFYCWSGGWWFPCRPKNLDD